MSIKQPLPQLGAQLNPIHTDPSRDCPVLGWEQDQPLPHFAHPGPVVGLKLVKIHFHQF